MKIDSLTFTASDDMHLHLRAGSMLPAVLPYTMKHFQRAIIMPNLVPPVTSMQAAESYRTMIIDARNRINKDSEFEPLMTWYLTDDTDVVDLLKAHRAGVIHAAKLYPAHATSNSQFGVTDITGIYGTLEHMERANIPLLVHGELLGPDIDVFDQEQRFIDKILSPICDRFTNLRIVMEHITTEQATYFVETNKRRMAATITPQHAMFNRNALLRDYLRPHLYCKPILKAEQHRKAVRGAMTSGKSCFFLGTDSAPWLRGMKECDCGCAGVFSSPVAMACYLEMFYEDQKLHNFEAFASINGAEFYGLPVNKRTVTYNRVEEGVGVGKNVTTPEGDVVPLLAGESVKWVKA